MSSSRFEYPIATCWDNIPVIKETQQAVILDGYWHRLRRGFYILLYDLKTHTLVKFLDTSISPHIKLKGKLPPGVPARTISLYNALTEKEEQVYEVETMDDNLYTNYRVGKIGDDVELVNAAINFDMLYFHETQITPGTIIQISDKKIETLIDEKDITEIRSKLLGESEQLIQLAELNLPLLEQKIPEMKRVAFDIEVKGPRGIFPVPEEAAFPIHAIGLYCDDTSILWMLGFPPTKNHKHEVLDEIGYMPEIRAFLSESELLEDFFRTITTYPVVLSFNGDNFDMPYLLNRGLRLGLHPPIAEGFTRGFYYKKQYHFVGTIHLDLFRFFANNSVRLYAFGAKYSRLRLNDVAEGLLGYKKIEHDLWFDEMSRSQMIAYTIRDVELTYRLTTFSNSLTIAVMLMIMRVGKMTLTQVNRASISNWILNWIAFEHSRKNWIIPPRDQLKSRGQFDSAAGIDGKGYRGAIVFEPEPGIFWDVTVADYASLYPSVIKKYRLSYETLRCNHLTCQSNLVPGLSHWVCKKDGIMSSLVGYVRDIRVKWYKSIASEGETEEIRTLASTIQAALKVFINASYGVFGNSKFALFCPPVAESTTAYSRHALLEARDKAEAMGYEVLYGDTDSVFIHHLTDAAFDQLKAWSIVTLGIELGIDYNFRYLVLSGRKKNYFGIKTDGSTITKGLSVKKSNTTQFIKDLYQEILGILSDVQSSKDLEEAVNQMVAKIRGVRARIKRGLYDPQELSRMVTLTKSFDSYTSTTPAVQVAIQVMTPENEAEYQQGQQFIVVPTLEKEVMVKTTRFTHFPRGYIMNCKYQEVSQVDPASINWSKFETELEKAFRPIFDAFDLNWITDIQMQTTLDMFL